MNKNLIVLLLMMVINSLSIIVHCMEEANQKIDEKTLLTVTVSPNSSVEISWRDKSPRTSTELNLDNEGQGNKQCRVATKEELWNVIISNNTANAIVAAVQDGHMVMSETSQGQKELLLPRNKVSNVNKNKKRWWCLFWANCLCCSTDNENYSQIN